MPTFTYQGTKYMLIEFMHYGTQIANRFHVNRLEEDNIPWMRNDCGILSKESGEWWIEPVNGFEVTQAFVDECLFALADFYG